MQNVFCFCDAADDRKSDHFVMNTFTVASGIHHNALGRRLNNFYEELLWTLNKEQINIKIKDTVEHL